MSTETIIIVVAVVVAIVAGMLSRIAGRITGLALIGGLMGWGAHLYGKGEAISFFGNPLSKTAFFGILGALAAYEVVSLVLAIRDHRRQRASRVICPACGATEVHDMDQKNLCARCQHTWS